MNSQGCKVSGGKIYFPEAYDFCPFCGTKLVHENEHEKATEIQVKQVSYRELAHAVVENPASCP
jgi:hypothetical protein